MTQQQTAAPAIPGVTRLSEKVETTAMEPLVNGTYVERDYSAYLWRCDACGLVWTRRHQARDCASRGHKPAYEDGPYGVTHVLNGVPQGNIHYFTRRAVRRDNVT